MKPIQIKKGEHSTVHLTLERDERLGRGETRRRGQGGGGGSSSNGEKGQKSSGITSQPRRQRLCRLMRQDPVSGAHAAAFHDHHNVRLARGPEGLRPTRNTSVVLLVLGKGKWGSVVFSACNQNTTRGAAKNGPCPKVDGQRPRRDGRSKRSSNRDTATMIKSPAALGS